MVVISTNNWKHSDNVSNKWLLESQMEVAWKEYQIKSGIKLIVQNLPALEENVQFEFESDSAPVQFLYCLSGGTRHTVIDKTQKQHSIKTANQKLTLSYLPETKGISIIPKGIPLQSVGLQIHPETLLQLVDEAGRSVCPQLYASIKSKNPQPYFHETELPLPIQITVQQILECMLSGSMKKIFLEYKALELMYTQLSLLDCALIKTKKITPYEHQTVMRAYKILMQDIVSPPPLLDLAKQAGITHTRLNQLFKTIYGKTVFGVLRQERLECSRRMLEDGRRTIAEVAYECGFSNPSHLSRAFVKQYGLQPKRYQAEHLKLQQKSTSTQIV
ncbi:helix-turn-helix domain-containing protein [Maridesulfovibrio salexigens]|uniref:Transcriptional regulator, AraC family n=1 Tax=Maridesulfovibrio salexigens (strain ATCC 14822 / DSM 2638 / NCIMB 8403 / VKM B-1763) TaxID=526222 RepID=C6BVU4_MARSD|nr:AraC family transcriptional regulator [Maridesulfovibrio salexigens]ACS80147.1 transcriptional regulator, AraC family [Maridesulfovibrio salexigens DSM 2638]